MRVKRFLIELLAVLTVFVPMAAEAAVDNPIAAKKDKSYDMPYYIGVDVTNQVVTVYRTKDDSIARQMLCSTGKNDATPLGSYFLPKKRRDDERVEWYYFYYFECYAKYATRITGNILFHSLTYSHRKESTLSQKAVREWGFPASHGCIRLLVEDAKFIAKNCQAGTFVKIYKSGKKDQELREILHVASYTGQDGMSYEEFMGIPTEEGDLGRYSEGVEVSDMQARLKELGYYDDDITGKYGVATMTAVKTLQKNLGIAESGIATQELREVIFSDFAPLHTGRTLSEGDTGPVVKKLQTALADLKLYEGPIDGIYDVEVKEAVKDFQAANYYTANGKATEEVQQAIYYQEQQLKDAFGSLEGLQVEKTVETIQMAKVEAKTKIIIREKASTESKEKGKVQNGDILIVEAEQNGWAKIKSEEVSGFMRAKYLNPYEQENIILNYTAAGSDKSYKMGYTLDEYTSGATSFAAQFSKYYTSEKFEETDLSTVQYITVNTGDPNVTLNLRSAADGESEVLTAVKNGLHLRALEVGDAWTLVSYEGHLGYLMNDYLTFWEGSVDALEEKEEEEEAELIEDGGISGEREKMYALVVSKSAERVGVYDAGSDDAKKLGTLPVKTKVEIVKASEDDDWVLISYKGKQGYMLDDNLQFQN